MRRLKQLGLLCFSLLTVVGCEKSVEPESDASSSAAKAYEAPEAGYIKNSVFVTGDNNRVAEWRLFQHASSTSYRISVDDKILALTRVGEEPWGKVSQSFRKKGVAPLLGKTLEFSIDVKGEFTDEYGEPMEPPSVTVKILGLRKGVPAMMGSSSLLFKSEPIVETLGLAPWRRYRIQFEVPEPEEARVTAVEVSVVMTMGGTLWARGPSLIEIDSDGKFSSEARSRDDK